MAASLAARCLLSRAAACEGLAHSRTPHLPPPRRPWRPQPSSSAPSLPCLLPSSDPRYTPPPQIRAKVERRRSPSKLRTGRGRALPSRQRRAAPPAPLQRCTAGSPPLQRCDHLLLAMARQQSGRPRNPRVPQPQHGGWDAAAYAAVAAARQLAFSRRRGSLMGCAGSMAFSRRRGSTGAVKCALQQVYQVPMVEAYQLLQN